MRIIVQKFGGTSVSDPEVRAMAISHVREALEEGLHPVVVVSAMGRKGAPYATDTLLGLVQQDESAGGASKRDIDLLLSCGEFISTVIMTDGLSKSGIEASAVTGFQAGIVTDSNFGDAHILNVNPERLVSMLEQGKVPVVAGFQGNTESGDLTTLGRGGSDTTAAALGAALHAEVVEIYTDVEGVMTADPRLVPDAKVLQTITYREVSEMAHMGAKVIHPRAVEIAMEERVPLKIRCTMSNCPGTLICDGQGPVDAITIKGDKVVTGIASISDMALVRLGGVVSKENGGQNPLRLFRVLASKGISVDLILVSPELLSFIVKETDAFGTQRSLDEMGLSGTVEKGYAKVSAVGAGMRGVPGVMASIVDALTEQGIQIYQTTDSHTTISCLVRQDDMADSVRALHSKFGLS